MITVFGDHHLCQSAGRGDAFVDDLCRCLDQRVAVIVDLLSTDVAFYGVGVSFNVLAKTLARNSITRLACSQSNSMCVENGPADNAKSLIQAPAPAPAQIIDKGIPTAGLLAHVMVARFADHLPLYRQEKIFGRAGLMIPRWTLAQWVGQTGVQLQPLVDALREAVLVEGVIHADEIQVQLLAPGEKKTHRAYV